MSDALLPFEPVYFEKGLTLESNVEENLFVKGSQQHLKQVADILLDNASKYASADSTVRVILRRQGKSLPALRGKRRGRHIQEDLKNIFKRFYRMDKARSMNHSYGLGLSIADSIVSNTAERSGRKARTGSIPSLSSCPRHKYPGTAPPSGFIIHRHVTIF